MSRPRNLPAWGRFAPAILLGLACVGFALTGCDRDPSPSPSPENSASRPKKSTRGLPNIVFAVYDNTRFDRYSINGNTRKTTPFFDKLASEGLYIPNGISPATWTFPSHASMFTGYRNHQLKVDMEQPNNLVLEPGVLTLAQILAARGYLTVTFPDHPYFGPVNASLSRGFRFFDILFNPLQTPGLSFTNVPTGMLIDRRVTLPKSTVEDDLLAGLEHRRKLGEGQAVYSKPDSDQEAFPPVSEYMGEYMDNRYAGLSEVLTNRGNRPFFLFLNLHNGPEHLMTVNQNNHWLIDYLEQNNLGPVPIEQFNELDGGFLKSDYIVAFCDATLEALQRKLADVPGIENTVYVVASDHGQAHGEHDEKTYYKHAYATPWEYMVHVPAIIHFPPGSRDRYPSGRIEHRISLTDLFFTVAEIGDCASDPYVRRVADMNGMSILARVRENRFEEYVFSESFMVIAYGEIKQMLPELASSHGIRDHELLIGNVYAIYKGGYKAIFAPQCRVQGRKPPLAVPVLVLFDLDKDPAEKVNTANQHPEIVEDLLAACENHIMTEHKVDFKTLGRSAYDEMTFEQLKALGYVRDPDN